MDAAEVVGNLLTHHGVKGMRWGIRRKATVGAQEVVIRDTRRKIKTSGGAGHPASAEAVRARTVGQISRKSGFKVLSNKDLEDYNRRLNLEQNAKRLRFEDSSPPKKFVLRLLGQTGKTTVQNAANDAASQAVKKGLLKAGLAAAA